MKHTFSKVPRAEISRSSFDRPHSHKTTFDAGLLVPIFEDEALPGDTFNLNVELFGRLATPVNPFMDNLYLDTFYFFVPNRLIWENWQRFNGEQVNPGESTDYLVPQVQFGPGAEAAELSIYDYLGIPTKEEAVAFNALHLRAYNLIWNEWFRDQNLQNSVDVETGDGPDDPAKYKLLRRGKRHDYFTSCLPWPQKGPAVELPLGDAAPVTGIGVKANTTSANVGNVWETENERDYALGWDSGIVMDGLGDPLRPAVYADLSNATAATINSLRQAFQVQRMYERDARGGTRYTEIVRAHFGVISPDQRLQRPEYLGGSSQAVIVNAVAQTSSSDQTTPQGNLAAMGTTSGRSGFTKSFTEHGVILGLACLRADLTYQQGLDRMWNRRTRFDYFWPALQHLGEQAVENREIYFKGDGANRDVFGYQERYAEYRYKRSKITGRFRSNATQTLDPWHLSQNFTTRPQLNSEFIEEKPPVDRIKSVPTEPHLIVDMYCRLKCARPMPVYGVPGLIDHF